VVEFAALMNFPAFLPDGSTRCRAMTSTRCFPCNDDGACESPRNRRFPQSLRECPGITHPLVGTQGFLRDIPPPAASRVGSCQNKTRGEHTKSPVRESPAKTQEHAGVQRFSPAHSYKFQQLLVV